VLSGRCLIIKSILRLIRPHQWLKNFLLFLPLLFSHQFGNPAKLWQASIGFLAFCLAASAIYVINDCIDISADRAHPRKRMRPLASGELTRFAAGVIVVVLLTLVASLSIFLPRTFGLVLGTYVVMALCYSFYFKSRLLVDVLILAGLYTIRVLAGGTACEVVVSPWLFVLSMFLFTSLAFAKRYTEIRLAIDLARDQIPGRGYVPQDLQIIAAVGPATGCMAVLVLALYVNGENAGQLYRFPQLLWLTCPLLLYWITRIWFFANRGALHDDPIVFAATDWKSWAVLLLCLALGLAAVFAR